VPIPSGGEILVFVPKDIPTPEEPSKAKVKIHLFREPGRFSIGMPSTNATTTTTTLFGIDMPSKNATNTLRVKLTKSVDAGKRICLKIPNLKIPPALEERASDEDALMAWCKEMQRSVDIRSTCSVYTVGIGLQCVSSLGQLAMTLNKGSSVYRSDLLSQRGAEYWSKIGLPTTTSITVQFTPRVTVPKFGQVVVTVPATFALENNLAAVQATSLSGAREGSENTNQQVVVAGNTVRVTITQPFASDTAVTLELSNIMPKPLLDGNGMKEEIHLKDESEAGEVQDSDEEKQEDGATQEATHHPTNHHESIGQQLQGVFVVTAIDADGDNLEPEFDSVHSAVRAVLYPWQVDSIVDTECMVFSEAEDTDIAESSMSGSDSGSDSYDSD
jgi:hypothetical protein